MVGPHYSRREFLLMLVFLSSCQVSEKETDPDRTEAGKGSCEDLSQVPEHDLKVRQTFAYVKESPIAENRCDNCKLWLPPKEGRDCGACLLFKGPVFASGYCTYWAPQE